MENTKTLITQWLQIDKSYNEKDIVNNILNSNIEIVKRYALKMYLLALKQFEILEKRTSIIQMQFYSILYIKNY